MLSFFQSLSLDRTYELYEIAVKLVIVGITIEEIPLGWLVIKFILECFSNGIASAARKMRYHWKELIEFVGVGILILGLLLESLSTTAARNKESQAKQELSKKVEKLGNELIEQHLNTDIPKESSKLLEERIKQLEDTVAKLNISPTESPRYSKLPPIIAQNAPRFLSDHSRLVIAATTRSGALISIIPFMPGPSEKFANELGKAFATIPGVQVGVGHGNFIMNGQTGLIVQYDHSNAISTSVFDALVKAGLNPIDGGSISGSVVTIKVAPP